MEILVAQLIGMALTFVTTLLCMVLPLKVFPQGGSRLHNHRTQRMTSLCNCLSGGVFLGTYFVALVPYIQEKFEQVLRMKKVKIHYPLTECTVVAGLFLIMFVEQFVKMCQTNNKKDSTSFSVVSAELQGLTHEPLLGNRTDSSESDNMDDKDQETTLFSAVVNNHTISAESSTNKCNSVPLQPPSRKDSPKQAHRPSHRGHGHSHGGRGHSHGGHGHSHLPEAFLTEQSIRSFILVVALSLHGFFEGLALGLQDSMTKLINIFIAVVTHECLVAFAMGVNLAKQNIRFSVAVKISIVLCLMIPVGMAIGMGIGGIHNFGGNLASAIIQGLAAGTFLYVIFLEILPEELQSPDDGLLKIFIILVGFILVACLAAVLQHDQ